MRTTETGLIVTSVSGRCQVSQRLSRAPHAGGGKEISPLSLRGTLNSVVGRLSFG